MRTLAILLFCLPVQFGRAQDKIAPPDAESLQKATALVRELYKEKYEAAATAEQKQALAAELLKKATTLQNDAATRYVILRDAGSYSVKAGDMKLALQVVEEMDRTFQIDAAKMKLAVVNAIQSTWKDTTAWTTLFDGKTLGKWLVVDEGEFRNHGAVQTENEGLYLRKGNPATGIRWAGQF